MQPRGEAVLQSLAENWLTFERLHCRIIRQHCQDARGCTMHCTITGLPIGVLLSNYAITDTKVMLNHGYNPGVQKTTGGQELSTISCAIFLDIARILTIVRKTTRIKREAFQPKEKVSVCQDARCIACCSFLRVSIDSAYSDSKPVKRVHHERTSDLPKRLMPQNLSPCASCSSAHPRSCLRVASQLIWLDAPTFSPSKAGLQH